MRVLVTGAGGFIGGHLVRRLVADGHRVCGADIRLSDDGRSDAHHFSVVDLREYANAAECDHVYQLAADMGGIGYITASHAEIMRNNVLINANMLEASRLAGVKRYLFTSSACVYPRSLKMATDAETLEEGDVMPADPEPGYGWEKLFSEQMTKAYERDHGLDVRIVRNHTIYGPGEKFDGERGKVVSTLCRKVAECADGGTIDVWGDGEQTRTFLYVEDAVDALVRVMASEHSEPMNLGSEDLVSINDLVAEIIRLSGKRINVRHIEGPQGARGRGCSTEVLRRVTGWEPTTSLSQGLAKTYVHVRAQCAK